MESTAEGARPPAQVSTFSNVLKRVPQVLIPYIGGSWGVVQCAEWLTNRYLLSPLLVDFCLYLCLLMLPTALLLAYYRGEPGATPWTRAEKVGIPLNTLIAATVLAIVFHGKDLGAATTTVTVKNDAGQSMNREIPKAAFRKRLALFFFDNDSSDQSLSWLGQGITTLLGVDLGQEPFVTVREAYEFAPQLKKAGLAENARVPMALKQELARNSHLDAFVSGSFSKQEGTYKLKVDLHRTQGKRIAAHNFQGSDLFQLVDEISMQLKQDLEIPSQRLESTPVLPVAEIMTHSLPALQDVVLGMNQASFRNDWKDAVDHLEQAVKKDPGFVWAQANLANYALLSNQAAKAQTVLNLSKQNEYKLPERDRFGLEYGRAFMAGDRKRALSSLKQWATLYPDDLQPYQLLLDYYKLSAEADQGIAVAEKILQLDPQQYDQLITLGELHQKRGHYDKALGYYQHYAAQFPREAKPYLSMAAVYRLLPNFTKAQSSYEEALTRDPENVSAQLGIVDVRIRIGKFTEALSSAHQALRWAYTPQDRASVYSMLQEYYVLRGQLDEALKASDLFVVEEKKFAQPLRIPIYQLQDTRLFIDKGQPERALKLIKVLERQLSDFFMGPTLLSMTYLSMYIRLEDAERAEPVLKEVEDQIRSSALGMLESKLLPLQGRVCELKNDYKQALQFYEQYAKAEPTNFETQVHVGRCLRKMNELKRAEAALKRVLELFPSHPEAHYELAKTYQAMNAKTQAGEQVCAALNTWSEADSDYKLANEARAFAAKFAITPREGCGKPPLPARAAGP